MFSSCRIILKLSCKINHMIKGVERIVISGLIKDEEMMRESCRMRDPDKEMKREREIKKRGWIGLEYESNFLEK